MIRRLHLPILFVLAAVASASVKPANVNAANQESHYLSPGELAISPDGRRLYVVCEKSDELRVVDTQTGRLVKRVAVGHVPRGLSLSADGKQIYVANSWTDTISVIDAERLETVRSLPTGFEPISVVSDRQGETLYVADRLSDAISVIDLRSGKEIKRLAAGRGASYLALSADGTRVYCTHIYPKIGAHRTPPESEITVIDTATRRVIDRELLHNVAGVFHLAISSDGKLGVAAHLRPKNLIPLAHVEHGWAFTDSLVFFGQDVGGVVQVPLDELERYFAVPFGVAIAPDKSKVFVSAAGSDNITVVNVPALLKFIHATPSVANDLSASANYVTARIPVGRNPRGIVLSPDGKRLYVATRMDDKIAVIDTKTAKVVASFDLGGPKEISPMRRGEQIFNSARFAFQGQFSCANCHLDATFDGLQWDLEPDGFGVDIVDNRSIEDLLGTQPYKWNGGNPDLPTECGPRTEKYFYRSQSYNSKELTDLVTFVLAIPVRPNRYRAPDGELTPAQERGKAIFQRIKYKDGRPIPENNRCATCHSGPKYTNNHSEDVGSGKVTDRSPLIDTPHLPDVAYSAPYLHDGSARSLEEIWTVFNPKDTHGVTNDLTKDQLNDLIEYVKTL
ncbi:MAG TPA: beta-propeller fold lactonase family protein [Terriglobales bacterium]|nr:beta-propeller fold lactonase family protein [Terriglobales bacterium]